MIYRNYRIENNENSNARFPNFDYIFRDLSLDDEDGTIGNGKSIEDCIEQINELILNKE